MGKRIPILALIAIVEPASVIQARLPKADAVLTCAGTESSHGTLAVDQVSDRPVTFTVSIDHAGCPTLSGTFEIEVCNPQTSRRVKRTARSIDVQNSRGTLPMSSYNQGVSLDYINGKIDAGAGGLDIGTSVHGVCVLDGRRPR